MPPSSKTHNPSPKPSAPLFIWISALILLIAVFLSTLALGNARRFHPDEAFYMTFSRNAAVNGDWWMLSEPVDKPPLTFYSNALSLVFLAVEADQNGVLQLDPLKGEFAGRIPSLFVSVILVAVVMALAKSLYIRTNTNHRVPTRQKDYVIYLAGLLAALSPFRIVFAATAFTDLPMLFFATISLWMAARGKCFWTGFWFIVSIWAKPQIIFYLPLIIVFLIYDTVKTDTIHHIPTKLLFFSSPILIGGLLLWGWDMARVAQGAQSFFVLGQARYTATMLTALADYPARFAEWWATVQYLFGNGFLTVIFSVIAIISIIRKRDTISLILLAWILAFFAAHMVLTLNLFDRNQIVLLPVSAILVARAMTDGVHHVPTTHNTFVGAAWILSALKRIILIALLFCLAVFSFFASAQKLPIGGDAGRHDGIDKLADYLNSKPVAAVIYDPWLDWELDYYMGVWTNKRRVFYPTPKLLIADALKLNEIGTRYFVVPVDVDEGTWLDVMKKAGFIVTLDYELPNFRVWALLVHPDS